MTTTSIKELLSNGVTPEELYKEYQKQITDAQNELEAEKKAKENEKLKQVQIDEARSAIVDALADYYEILGINWNEDRMDSFEEGLKHLEKFFTGDSNYFNFSTSISSTPKEEKKQTKKSNEKIIADFFKKYGL